MEHAGRNRRVVDFFGNVQGVEVQGNTTELESWKKDLEGLRRLVNEYDKSAARQEKNATELNQLVSQRTEPPSPTKQAGPIGRLNIDEKTWTNQIVGINALSVLVVLWYFAPKIV